MIREMIETMTKEEKYTLDLGDFAAAFYSSEAYKKLKSLDSALYENKEVQEAYKEKKAAEENLSLAFSKEGEEKKNAMDAFSQAMRKLNDIPAVKEYNEAFYKVAQVKKVFEDRILRRLS